eukprot:309672-Prymnesium_polylepis.1
MEELGIGHFHADCDLEKENDVYFIIDKLNNLFSWDQVGWKTALSDDCAAGSADSTLRIDQYDFGQLQGTASTRYTREMTLAAMKDPPRSSFKDKEGMPRVAAFYPHKSGGFVAEMAGGWMRNVIGPCFENEINEKGEHILGLGDGLGAHMSPEMVEAAIEVGIDIQLRVPHSSHRTQPEDRRLFQRFKALARGKIDLQIGINISKGQGARLTDSQRRRIFKESWGEAFSVANMRGSWAETGFREDAIHGYVCDRKEHHRH